MWIAKNLSAGNISMSSQSITIKSSKGGDVLNDFIHVPHTIYKDDPHWIAPLTIERREHFSFRHNPFFAHAQVRFFVAYNTSNKPVGRISAQIDNQEETYNTIGHFGCLEAINKHVMAQLLAEAENWLGEKGIKEVTGPYSLSINDEVGLLVSGYNASPKIMMNYAPKWYAEALEALGYSKIKDLHAFELHADTPFPINCQKMAAHILKKENIHERPIALKKFHEELSTVMDIFNDAWSDNWGFTPMTEPEIKYMAKNLRPIIDAEMARIIEVDGTPAGMIVTLPDINQALKGLKGQLLPLGWLKLFYRLKIKKISGGRVVLMGIKKEYQNTRLGGGLAVALVTQLQKIGQQRGYKHVELSWLLEDNIAMRKIIEFVGGKHYKTYRIYKKNLEGSNG